MARPDESIKRMLSTRVDISIINRMDKCARERSSIRGKVTRVDVLMYCIKHGLKSLESKRKVK